MSGASIMAKAKSDETHQVCSDDNSLSNVFDDPSISLNFKDVEGSSNTLKATASKEWISMLRPRAISSASLRTCALNEEIRKYVFI